MEKSPKRFIRKLKKFFSYITILSLIVIIISYTLTNVVDFADYSNKILQNFVKFDSHHIEIRIFGQTKLKLFTLDFQPYIEIHDVNIGINNQNQYIISKVKLYLSFNKINKGIFTISNITIEDSSISLTSLPNIDNFSKLENNITLPINLKNIKLTFNNYINNININHILIKNKTLNGDIKINNEKYNLNFNFNNKNTTLKLKSKNLFIDYDNSKEEKTIAIANLYQLIENLFKKNNIIKSDIPKTSKPIKLQISIKDIDNNHNISIKSKIIDLSYTSSNDNILNIDIKKIDISDIFNQNLIFKNPKNVLHIIEKFPEFIYNFTEKKEKKISIENLILSKDIAMKNINFSAIEIDSNKLSLIGKGKFNDIQFNINSHIYSEYNQAKLLGKISLQNILNKESNKISSLDFYITKYSILLKDIILNGTNNALIKGNIKISKTFNKTHNINSDLNINNYTFNHKMFSYLKNIFINQSIFADQNIYYNGHNNTITDINNLQINNIQLFIKAHNRISDYNIKNITADQIIGSTYITWNNNVMKNRLDINSNLSLLNYKILGIDPINDFKNKKLQWSRKPIGLNKNTNINGIININIDHLTNPDIVDIDKILIRGEIQKNNIKIDKLTGSIKNKNYNTEITSKGTIKFHDGLLFNIFVDLQNTNINYILNKLLYINDINGIMNMSGLIISNGHNMEELIKNINGKFNFVANNLNINGIDIDYVLSKMHKIKNLSELNSLTRVGLFQNNTDIQSPKGILSIKNGINSLSLHSTTINSSNVLVLNHSFLSSKLNGIMRLYFAITNKSLTADMKIQGSIYEPKIFFDNNTLFSNLQE